MTPEKLLGTGAEQIARLWNSFGAAFGFALLAAYVAAVVGVAIFYPTANWDMVAYVAAALDDGSRSLDEVHRAAWAAVRDRVSEGEFLVLTSDRPYRVHQYADAQAFSTMLGFYEVKLLYVKLASLLSHWMQPIDALRLISACSAAILGAIVIFWARDQKSLPYAPLILALLILSGFGTVAVIAVPDLFASVFLVLAAWLYLRKLDIACAVALLLAFLARPDHLAFIAIFAVAALLAREGFKSAAAALVIALIAYFPIVRMAGHPGWWVQMWFTHVEYVPTLEGFAPDFSLLTYVKILMRVVVRSLVEEPWLALFIVECAVLGSLVLRRVPMRNREAVLLLAIVVTVFAKFFVAPLHETRFHIAYLLALGMVLLGVWTRNAREARTPNVEARAPAAEAL